jgi:PAS domain S-box-containing protein
MDELKELRQRLEAAEKRAAFLRQVIDVSPTFIFAKDREGRFTLVNRAIAEAYGTSVEELVGKRDEDFNPNKNEVAFFRRMDLEVMDRQTPRLIPLEQITDSTGNIRWLQTIKTPMVDDDGTANHVLGSATDITLRRQAEIQLRNSEFELRESQRRLRKLTGRLLTAQEDERRRLAREIHDDLTQRLAVLTLKARELGTLVGTERPEVTALIHEIHDAVKSLSNDSRHLSHQLHPAILEDLGLVDALTSECDAFSKRHDILVGIRSSAVPTDLPPDVAICLYRISQEALNNVAKHASTRAANVSIAGSDDQVELIIEDSGKGFDLGASHSLGGVGLSSMQERARLIDADFAISSTPGQGTRVSVRVPLER